MSRRILGNRNAFNDGYYTASRGCRNKNPYNNNSENWKRYNLGFLKGTIDLQSGESNESERNSCNSIKVNKIG